MLKKFFAAVAVGVLLAFGGASAATAYVTEVECTATPPSFAVGQSTTVFCTGLIPGSTTFSITGPNGTTTTTVTVDENGELNRVVTPPAAGNYTITATDSEGNVGSVGVTVTAATAGGGSGGSGSLPATGGTVPAAALWLGIGALGIGGIAVAAAAARRRANSSN